MKLEAVVENKNNKKIHVFDLRETGLFERGSLAQILLFFLLFLCDTSLAYEISL